jgi:radical SAM protein with 4Fe4S-binding SPASM domain
MSKSADKVLSRLAPSFLPPTAVLEMTYRCNHRCAFCSCPWEEPDGGFTRFDELSIDAWKDVLRTLAGMGVCTFAFTGGEPLLKRGLFDLMEYAATLTSEHIESVDGGLQSRMAPPRLHLLSNGLAVDWAVIDFCKRFDVQLSMSLPGLSTYREHTGAGDPDHILAMFTKAAREGVATVAAVTVTRKNLAELHATISAALLAGARQLLLNRFLPGGRGLENAEQLWLDRHQVREMLDTAEEVLRDADRYGSVGTELPKCILDGAKFERLQVGTRCSAAIDFFVVDPSGYIRACNHSPKRLNHVAEIDKVKTHPYWRRFTQKDYLPTACGGCNWIGECDGGCREAAHIVTGALDGPDMVLASTPFHGRMARSTKSRSK